MAKYIDADAAKRKTDDLSVLETPTTVHFEHMKFFIKTVIDATPASDVAPVKRGQWLEVDRICTHSAKGRTTHIKVAVCSFCNISNGRAKKRFCPNCGAVMGNAEK